METKEKIEKNQKVLKTKVLKRETDNSVYKRVLCYDGVWRITKNSPTYLAMLESLANWEKTKKTL